VTSSSLSTLSALASMMNYCSLKGFEIIASHSSNSNLNKAQPPFGNVDCRPTAGPEVLNVRLSSLHLFVVEESCGISSNGFDKE
jgi:hypothetical protein